MHIQIKKYIKFVLFIAFICANHNPSFAIEPTAQKGKYPNFASEYLGEDKYENLNRKIFIFNSKLNKYAIRPLHIVWASVMPKCGMDIIQNAYINIEYPKRLASTLIQKDFKASKHETLRFLLNSTVGIGGLFDPAKKYFALEPLREDMGQALAKLKVKQGPYLVVPVMQSSTPRAIAGEILEVPLDPSIYMASPVTALVKAGFLINRTSYMQPLSKTISAYADPYDITKKLYGIESHIKIQNFDRIKELAPLVENSDNNFSEVAESQNEEISDTETTLKPDIILTDYNPQSPVIDSMRTALFELPEIYDSIWAEFSLWNRSFAKRIKTSSVSLYSGREDYQYKYILQKDKTAPIAIIYPSIGEGITSHHCTVLAKLFWDEGYSVLIQGSSFNWEFVKSMPKGYRPGMPSQDADYLRITTSKILDSLRLKHDCKPKAKVMLGTSFGAITTLFVADKESKNRSLNISKYIAINPPIDLFFAMRQIDKNNEAWSKNIDGLKDRTAATAAKIIQMAKIKNESGITTETMPFSEDEAKLITGFIIRQKLSDVIFTLENASKSRKTNIYEEIDNISYYDYVEKYLLKEYKSAGDLSFDVSLHSISDFLKSNNNYKIYHTPDDYLTNAQQLKQLKQYCENKTVLLSNGSHMGFLYRQEFIDALKKDISLKDKSEEL